MRSRFLLAFWTLVVVLSSSTRAGAHTMYALAPPFFLVQFDSAEPETLTHVAVVTGLAVGERLEAIDFRPRTGQLYGLGVVHGSTDTLRVYRIDPLSGAATLIPGSTPFEVTNGVAYGFDFNPTVDRIRVTNDADENFRINPNTGARADAPTPDTDLNPPGFEIRALAYDRNFDTGLAVASRSTAYAISVATESLMTIGGVNQSPSPNGGQLLLVGSTRVVFAGSNAAFDIPPASNRGYAALRDVTGLTHLFQVDLHGLVGDPFWSAGRALPVGTIGNGAFDVTGLAVAPASTVVVGSGPRVHPEVRVFDGQSDALWHRLSPYSLDFTGGVRVATGDVNLDGIPDVITAPGPGGGPHVQVFDGEFGTRIASYFVYSPAFTGGVFVAAGDVNGDGHKDVIAGADAGGGPHVRVLSGATSMSLLELFAYSPAFTGGVRVAAADFDRDGDYEIITAPGPGGGPHVKVFDASGNPFTSPSLPDFVNSFFAYSAAFTGGVFVAAGDVNGDGVPDIVTGAGAGGGPHVRAISGANGAVLTEFFAYEAGFAGGVRVAVADVNGDGRYDIITTPGEGRADEVRAFDGVTRALLTWSRHLGGGAGAFVGGVRW